MALAVIHGGGWPSQSSMEGGGPRSHPWPYHPALQVVITLYDHAVAIETAGALPSCPPASPCPNPSTAPLNSDVNQNQL